MAFQPILVLITVPSASVGAEIAQHLLDHKLAACVNILPGIQSFYIWEGAVQNDTELLLVAKTHADIFQEKLVPAVLSMHPYKVPEIIALPVVQGLQSYLDWMDEVTRG